MANKTILITSKENNSLTNFNQEVNTSYDNFRKQESTFKRNRQRMSANFNDFEISFNPFISSSSHLLKYVLELRDFKVDEDMAKIRDELIVKVNLYNENILKHNIENAEILVTRYILCTFVDEIINTIYLGTNNNWATNSLLSIFHNETYGGENFFHLLDKFLKTPAKYIHILELMYVCISLGFEGKYRVMERGKIELNTIKDSLFKQIKIVQGREPLNFYIKQIPAKEKYNLFNKTSYPVLFSVVFSIIMILYISLSFSLHIQNDNFLEKINEKTIISKGDK